MLGSISIWRRAAAAAAVAAATVLVIAGSASANGFTHRFAGGDYLALGDSVAFGYRTAAAVDPPDYADAGSFVGYPELLGPLLREHLANASCPGETTGSFLTGSGSNGCEDSPAGPIGYRTFYPLHVQYGGTQLAYALSFLAAHPDTRLVTIDLGANDTFVCQETTADRCTNPAELAAVLHQVATNLATIYGAIRGAHYTGPIVALEYYALNYRDATGVAGTLALNQAIAAAGTPFHVTEADGFRAFAIASAPAGGDPCKAGLLVRKTDGTCDVHPTLLGHLVLAGAIAHALHAGF